MVQKLRQCQDTIVRIDLCHDGTCIRLTYWGKDRQGTGYHFAIFIISIIFPYNITQTREFFSLQ